MNPLRHLENRIRGWLPKEPNQPSIKIEVAGAPAKALKVLWYVVVFTISALMVAVIIMFFIPFYAESLVNRTIVLLLWVLATITLSGANFGLYSQ